MLEEKVLSEERGFKVVGEDLLHLKLKLAVALDNIHLQMVILEEN